MTEIDWQSIFFIANVMKHVPVILSKQCLYVWMFRDMSDIDNIYAWKPQTKSSYDFERGVPTFKQ